jgi:hypothetical protein
MAKKSPEESGEGRRPERGGAKERREGGFADGEMGRGSTPYHKSHSAKQGTIAQHDATSGRGGSGIIGGGDDFKGHKTDIEHPASHAEFEELGTDRATDGRD